MEKQRYNRCSLSLFLTVVFDVFRHVVVDDVLDVWEIKTFRRDVSCYENVFLASTEQRQRLTSLFLIWKVQKQS